VFSLQPLVYPEVVGKAIPVDAVTTGGVMANAFMWITMVGAVLLAVMLTLYIRVVTRRTSSSDIPT
jgi:hypothetical protein